MLRSENNSPIKATPAVLNYTASKVNPDEVASWAVIHEFFERNVFRVIKPGSDVYSRDLYCPAGECFAMKNVSSDNRPNTAAVNRIEPNICFLHSLEAAGFRAMLAALIRSHLIVCAGQNQKGERQSGYTRYSEGCDHVGMISSWHVEGLRGCRGALFRGHDALRRGCFRRPMPGRKRPTCAA